MLIEARKKQELTQSALAKKLKKLQAYVSKYERGERRIDLVEFLDIARILNIDITLFVSELEKRARSKKYISHQKNKLAPKPVL
jgi:transcriptional regulator with XRE-family HTH domain